MSTLPSYHYFLSAKRLNFIFYFQLTETAECTRKSCMSTREEVKKLREQVKHLELQVKSHKEDWEAEREEKKTISAAKDELERRFSAALRDLYCTKVNIYNILRSLDPVLDFQSHIGIQKQQTKLLRL